MEGRKCGIILENVTAGESGNARGESYAAVWTSFVEGELKGKNVN